MTTTIRVGCALPCLLWALILAVGCNSAPPTPAASAAKLLIAEEGMAQIVPGDLRAVGWAESDVPALRVTRDGQEVPTWLVDGVLRFYAPISPTRYMSETVFWLERGAGSGAQMLESPLDAGSLSQIDRYTATTRLEENHIYSPQVADGDHWLWAQFIAPATRTVTVTLSALMPGPARLRVEVWGNTEAQADPDHRYRVSMNGQDLGEATWDGSGYHTIDLAVPDDALRDGENVVTLFAPGMPEVTVDGTYLNAVTLSYPRSFMAQDDILTFESAGGLVRFDGFSGPITVFDVTDPERPARQGVTEAASFAIKAGRRYWAVGPRGYRSGRWQAAQLTPDLRATVQGAPYVAIGPVDLLMPLQPLLDWHTTQGLTTTAIPIEAIYDQFGGGRAEPQALLEFLQYAVRHWEVPPHYVLLVGDASYDMLNYAAPPEANRTPTFLVQTVYGGETASDVPLAQLDDDNKPDVAVGRLPARTAAQVEVYVRKALAYEKDAPAGEWTGRVLAVADGQDPSFRADAESFLNRFGQDFETQLINPPAGVDQASAEIVEAWNRGQGIIGYFGHGSVTQWGKDNAFTVKDVPALQNNGMLPVVIHMTCLTGLFSHPKVQSLTEALLWQPDSGAVAALAPTSLTLATDQSFLTNALVAELLKDHTARLGDVLLRAQQVVPQDGPGARDVLQTFLLFGDPALRLARP
jgi:hypothetical protein